MSTIQQKYETNCSQIELAKVIKIIQKNLIKIYPHPEGIGISEKFPTRQYINQEFSLNAHRLSPVQNPHRNHARQRGCGFPPGCQIR